MTYSISTKMHLMLSTDEQKIIVKMIKSEDFLIIFVTRLIFCFSFNLLANKDLPLNVDIHLLILRNFLKSFAECSPFDVTMAKATCILKPL